MKAFATAVILTISTIGLASAQGTAPGPNGQTNRGPATIPAAPDAPVLNTPMPDTTTTPGTARPMTGQPAASGDRNQAVTTTNANAAMPAKGANSFTAGQVQGRLKDKGYDNVTGLQKDHDGVWHGKASKGGQQFSVWVDYKGNVGQQ